MRVRQFVNRAWALTAQPVSEAPMRRGDVDGRDVRRGRRAVAQLPGRALVAVPVPALASVAVGQPGSASVTAKAVRGADDRRTP